MFLYCFDNELRNRLIAEQHELISSGTNEKGSFWVFELIGNFNFTEQDKQNESFIFSKRLTF